MMRRAALSVLVIAATALAAGCGSSTPSPSTGGGTTTTASDLERQASALGCTIEHPTTQVAEHIGEGPHPSLTHPPYSSNPPVSGPHFGIVTDFGFYDKPVADEYVIHNLEHGAVAYWYGGAPSDWKPVAQQLTQGASEVVIVPRASLPNDTIVAGSWGALMRCPAAAVQKAGRDKIGVLLLRWENDMINSPAAGEAGVQAIIAGTRTTTTAYTDARGAYTALPPHPKPVIDTTLRQ